MSHQNSENFKVFPIFEDKVNISIFPILDKGKFLFLRKNTKLAISCRFNCARAAPLPGDFGDECTPPKKKTKRMEKSCLGF